MCVGSTGGNYDVILDGIFGFGFKGDPRPPFDTILKDLSRSSIPVVSIDVPSGWSASLPTHSTDENRRSDKFRSIYFAEIHKLFSKRTNLRV